MHNVRKRLLSDRQSLKQVNLYCHVLPILSPLVCPDNRQKSAGSAAAKADGHGGFHNPMAALRAAQMLERGGGGARGIGTSSASSGGWESTTPSPATSLDGGRIPAGATPLPSRLPFQDPASMNPAGAIGGTSLTPLAIPAWMMAKGRASALRSPTGVLGRQQARPGQPQLRSPTLSPPRDVLPTPLPCLSPQRDSLTNASVAPSSGEVSSRSDAAAAETSETSGSLSSRDEARRGSDSTGDLENSAAVDDVSVKGRETLPVGNDDVAGKAAGVGDVSSALPFTAKAPGEGGEDITSQLDAKDPIDDRRTSPTAVSEKPVTAAAAAIEQPAANSEEASEESFAVDMAVGMAESADTPAESRTAKDSREDILGESKDHMAASGVATLAESVVRRVSVPALTEGMSTGAEAGEEDGLQGELGDAPVSKLLCFLCFTRRILEATQFSFDVFICLCSCCEFCGMRNRMPAREVKGDRRIATGALLELMPGKHRDNRVMRWAEIAAFFTHRKAGHVARAVTRTWWARVVCAWSCLRVFLSNERRFFRAVDHVIEADEGKTTTILSKHSPPTRRRRAFLAEEHLAFAVRSLGGQE